MPREDGKKIAIDNRRARHEFAIDKTYEAGIALRGMEVKALREGRGQIREAYAVVRDGEATLLGMHISPYSGASTHEALDPVRPRRLLLHKREIDDLEVQTRQKGMTVVPLRVYFTRGLAKVELGVGRGKKQVDKRRDIAAREAKRQMERTHRRRAKGM